MEGKPRNFRKMTNRAEQLHGSIDVPHKTVIPTEAAIGCNPIPFVW
jgi:hypothetical protein